MARPKHKSLDTLEGLRDEMLRLYLKAKSGKIEPKELGKLIYALNTVSQLIREIEVVDRLDKLEETQEMLNDVSA
ncbi:hypothetical protein SYK_05140 [Pseudodesulfovibrio nedwellii]|uniref:Uncharacterized protein n=1 Tax=Pseudodesulfovibrio nedwellii TaxID=2973072 RepID=A0ABM8AXA1_9BACT|nr:hypothetical protein [Pseudodesulfovibrio nedwellii]BDQ36154.1 hypothetical protein SYK_05140 [Pseudodesulfovibrio nedwellii]